MSRQPVMGLALCVLLLAVGSGTASAGGSRIGGGAHFQQTLGDIDKYGFSQTSYSLMGSYQYSAGLLKFEGDVDYVFDYAGTDKALWEPSAWVLTGGMLYGGIGTGIGYTDGSWQDDPFFGLRAGVDFRVGRAALDIFGTYRFQDGQSLSLPSSEDLDRATFAALVRFGI